MNLGWMTRIILALSLRPSLWLTAGRQAHRLAGRGWWRRPPFLPVPARAFARFRALTQYGEPDRPPDVVDVVTWLVWARDMERTGPGPPGEGLESNY